MASLIIGEEDGGKMCIPCTTHTYTVTRDRSWRSVDDDLGGGLASDDY